MPATRNLSAVSRRSLNLIFLGDSHFNGNQQKAAAVSDTSGNIGTLALAAPLDRMWDGSAEAAVFKADCQINSVSTPNVCQDQANTALVPSRAGPIIDLLDCLRRSHWLGKIKIANLAVGGSSTYTWAGEMANGFVGAFGTPSDGDTITLGSKTYTFRTTPSVANDVLINGANGSIQNLMKACNAEAADAASFGTGTTANADIVALNPASTQYGRFYARVVGTAGNSLTLTGGVAARVTPVTPGLAATSSQALQNGSATSALYANGKAQLTGFGTVDAVCISLGTNDAGRSGMRGTRTGADYATLIANVRTDFPSAKIIITKPFYSRNATTQTALTNTVVPAISTLLSNNPDIEVVDLFSLGLGAGDVSIVESSGAHGTQYGYSLMSQLFARKIASALSLTN